MAAAEAAPSGAPLVVTGRMLRQGLERSLRRLAEQKSHINDLNVFPVPDGDTGTNMHLTLEAAWREVSRLPEKAEIAAVAKAAAHGSLMGARGNSGVILSQILRGWSAASEKNDALDADGLSEALAEGSRVAYLAVKRPVDGTILSVARDSARAAHKSLASGADLVDMAEAVVTEAWAAVERSRDQMEVLRQAGVVDAGGYGLAVILTAISERISGHNSDKLPQEMGKAVVPVSPPEPSGLRGAAAAIAPEEGFGYCTEFALIGSEKDAAEIRSTLGDEDEDDSALVVGEPGLLHVHLHTHEPWDLLVRAAKLGKIERLKVEDMTTQHHDAWERAVSSSPAATLAPLGVVTVAQGEGFRELLMGLGAAAVIEGGQSLNPSTEQILAGIAGSGAEEVLLLPNNANLVLGAEQAAEISDREAAVVPSRNLPQGIAALLAFDSGSPLEVNRHRMERAMEGVHAIEVTTAVRDSTVGKRKVARGALIGILDGRLVSSGEDIPQVVIEALESLPKRSVEVVTLYRGSEVEPDAAEELERAIRARFPDLEVERHDGGQALYQFVISAE